MKDSPRERRLRGKVMKVFMKLTTERGEERRGLDWSRHGNSGGGRLDGC